MRISPTDGGARSRKSLQKTLTLVADHDAYSSDAYSSEGGISNNRVRCLAADGDYKARAQPSNLETIEIFDSPVKATQSATRGRRRRVRRDRLGTGGIPRWRDRV